MIQQGGQCINGVRHRKDDVEMLKYYIFTLREANNDAGKDRGDTRHNGED